MFKLSVLDQSVAVQGQSGARAIHGIILVGAITVTDHADTNLQLGLGIAAVVLATINMVGGFVVTDRMLEMFKGKPRVKKSVDAVGGETK